MAVLSDFLATEIQGNGIRIPAGVVDAIPLRHLDFALRQWLRTGWDKPFMAYAALEAAWFVNAHFWGEDFDESGQPPWKIRACRPNDYDEGRFEVLYDAAFKRQFTFSYGGLVVECAVPEGLGMAVHLVPGQLARELSPGDSFLFGIERCPLSASPWGHVWTSSLTVASPRSPDLCSLFLCSGLLLSNDPKERGVFGSVPLSWVTAVGVLRDRTQTPIPLPVWRRSLD